MTQPQTDTRITREEFKILSIVVLVAICGMLGVDIHLASLPHIMTYMHTDQAHMQQSISVFLLGMGGSLLFYGPLSDKHGRKPIVIFGLALAAIASFATAFTHDISSFLAMRLLQGIGSGVCVGVGRTIVADVLQGVRFAIIGSYFAMVISLSPMLAPALGGYIQNWFGWQENFIVLGSILTAVVLLYGFICPETNKHINPHAFTAKGLVENYATLLSHGTFIGCTLVTGLLMACNMAYATISPFVFQIQYHLSPVAYGWVTALAATGSIVGKIAGPISIRRLGSHRTIVIGLSLVLLSGISMLLLAATHLDMIPLIILSVFITIFCISFMGPILTAYALTPFTRIRGSAGALYGSFQMLTAFISSAIIAMFTHDGIIILAIAYCILGILAIISYFKLVERTP